METKELYQVPETEIMELYLDKMILQNSSGDGGMEEGGEI